MIHRDTCLERKCEVILTINLFHDGYKECEEILTIKLYHIKDSIDHLHLVQAKAE